MSKKQVPDSEKGKRRNSILTVKAVEKESEEYVLNFVGSSETLDRGGDIVKSDSWQLDAYKKNPVFLWGHKHSDLPIGKAINVSVNKENKSLDFEIKFAVDEYPFAKTVYKLYKGGYLNATSVGFIPKEMEYDEEKDAFILSDNELLELSAVTVPANPDALQQGFQKGVLDGEDLKGMKKQGMLEAMEKGMDEQEVEDLEQKVEDAVEEPAEEEIVDTTTEGTKDSEEQVEEPDEETDPKEEPQEEDPEKGEDEEEVITKSYLDKLFKGLNEEIVSLKKQIMGMNEKLVEIREQQEWEITEEDGEETPEKTQTEDPKPEDIEEDEVEEESVEPQVITFVSLKNLFSGKE